MGPAGFPPRRWLGFGWVCPRIFEDWGTLSGGAFQWMCHVGRSPRVLSQITRAIWVWMSWVARRVPTCVRLRIGRASCRCGGKPRAAVISVSHATEVFDPDCLGLLTFKARRLRFDSDLRGAWVRVEVGRPAGSGVADDRPGESVDLLGRWRWELHRLGRWVCRSRAGHVLRGWGCATLGIGSGCLSGGRFSGGGSSARAGGGEWRAGTLAGGRPASWQGGRAGVAGRGAAGQARGVMWWVIERVRWEIDGCRHKVFP